MFAFDDFHQREHPKLVRAITALTGRASVAEEVVQEAMLAAHRRWLSVQALDRPDLWVRRVAVNRSISAHRRLVVELRSLARFAPATLTEPVPEQDTAVWAAVRKLSRQQAAAIVLSAVDGLSSDEVGHVLGCSATTARAHVHRARNRLRDMLGEERTDDDLVG